MSLGFRLLVMVVLASTASCGAVKSATDESCEPYALRFAPGDALKVQHRVEIRRWTETYVEPSFKLGLKGRGSTRATSEDTIRRTEAIELRREETGYLMTVKPDAAVVLRENEPGAAMAHVPYEKAIIYHLSSAGRVVRIEGFEDIARRMQAAATDDTERALAASATPEAFANDRKLEWDELVGGWAGSRGCVGDYQVHDAQLLLPAGPVRVRHALRVSRLAPCSTGECLSIERRFSDDTGTIDAWVNDFVGKPGYEISQPHVASGRAKIVVERASLRPLSAEVRRTSYALRETANERTRTRIHETRFHYFDYR